jgi:hypothetical protein
MLSDMTTSVNGGRKCSASAVCDAFGLVVLRKDVRCCRGVMRPASWSADGLFDVAFEGSPGADKGAPTNRQEAGAPTFSRLRRDRQLPSKGAVASEPEASGFIFGEGASGEPPTQQTASNRVLRTLAALGLPGVTHHTMRHTGVTLMLDAGVNPRAIQKLAGWTSLRMLERYGHARDAEVRRAMTANADYLQQAATKTATLEKRQRGKSEA